MRTFCLLLMCAITLACGTTKKLKTMPSRSKTEVVKALTDRNIDFEWFTAKMSTSLSSPDENVSATMVVRMKRDSAILVAVKKFGFEAARLHVDKKGYTLLYRLEKVYEQGDISKINDVISITADFEDLQQLIMGNVILPDTAHTSMTKDSIYYIINGRLDGLLLEYYVNGYDLQLEKIKITDRMNRTAIAQYSDYRPLPGFGKVSYARTFRFPYSKSEDANIEMNFSEIEINHPTDIKFSIPQSYEKIN